MVIRVVHHPDYCAPLPQTAGGAPHRFPMSKFAQTMTILRTANAEIIEYLPAETPRAAIEAVHDPAYVAAILSQTLNTAAARRIGFPITPQIARRSLLASGGTWMAAKLAFEFGYAANTAGGSHHAHADFGAGFCVFNDIAIAAQRLLDAGDAARILIIDLDVHQGDGTAAIFANDQRVFTFSVHCADNFPVRKRVSDFDIALRPATGDDDYNLELCAALAKIATSEKPDIIFYLAGVDPHWDDKLGKLLLTDSGLAARDKQVALFAQWLGVPLVSVMGGGYGDDVTAVAARHAQTILTVAAHY